MTEAAKWVERYRRGELTLRDVPWQHRQACIAAGERDVARRLRLDRVARGFEWLRSHCAACGVPVDYTAGDEAPLCSDCASSSSPA